MNLSTTLRIACFLQQTDFWEMRGNRGKCVHLRMQYCCTSTSTGGSAGRERSSGVRSGVPSNRAVSARNPDATEGIHPVVRKRRDKTTDAASNSVTKGFGCPLLGRPGPKDISSAFSAYFEALLRKCK